MCIRRLLSKSVTVCQYHERNSFRIFLGRRICQAALSPRGARGLSGGTLAWRSTGEVLSEGGAATLLVGPPGPRFGFTRYSKHREILFQRTYSAPFRASRISYDLWFVSMV